MNIVTTELSWKDRTNHFITPEQKNKFGNLSPFTDFIIFYQLNQWKVPNVEITYEINLTSETIYIYDEKLAEIRMGVFKEEMDNRNNNRKRQRIN